jgi:hypothetical protein
VLVPLFVYGLVRYEFGQHADARHVMVGFLVFWAAFLANGAVVQSIQRDILGNTLDIVRMSSLRPMDVVLGRCFGAALPYWPGIFLMVYAVVAAVAVKVQKHYLSGAVVPAGAAEGTAVFVHLALQLVLLVCACNLLCFAILLYGKVLSKTRHGWVGGAYARTVVMVLGVFIGVYCLRYAGLQRMDDYRIIWFGAPVPGHVVMSVICLCLCALSLLAARNMAARLMNERTPMLSWPLGMVIVALVLFGLRGNAAMATAFPPEQAILRHMVPFFMLLCMGYWALFHEIKDAGILRKMRFALAHGRWREILAMLPDSAYSLVMVIMAAVLLAGVEVQDGESQAFQLALVLMFMRDLALVYIFAYLRPVGMGVKTLYVAMGCIYILMPLIIGKASSRFFIPHPGYLSESIIVSSVIAVLAVGFLIYRGRQLI